MSDQSYHHVYGGDKIPRDQHPRHEYHDPATTQVPVVTVPDPTVYSSRRKIRPTWPYLIGACLIAFVLGAGCDRVATAGSTARPAAAPVTHTIPPSAAQPDTPLPPVPPPALVTTFGEGTFEVGVDVAPGKYKTAGVDAAAVFGSCYWARRSDSSGSVTAILANDNTRGPAVVTLSAGEYFESTRCQPWTLQG